MFSQLIESIEKLTTSAHELDELTLLELPFIAHFGTKLKAEKALKKLQQKFPDQKQFEQELDREVGLSTFQKLSVYINDKDLRSIKQLIEFDKQLQNNESDFPFTDDEIQKMQTFFEKYFLIIEDLKNSNRFSPFLKDFFSDEVLNKKIFSKRDIYIECEVNQRTFAKWLMALGLYEKYKGRKLLSFKEYFEIQQCLFWGSESNKFGITANREAYYKRLVDGLVFTKEQIISISESDYKTVAKNVKKIFEGYKNLDKYPYELGIKFIEKMS